MLSKHLKSTYSLLVHFIFFFVVLSFLLRAGLLIFSFSKADVTTLALLRIFSLGIVYDLGIASFFAIPYALYLLLLPVKWADSTFNRTLTYAIFFLVILVVMFSFFAEITFWQEFESRFNFIAVDYLVYTYEVIHNINESYPLPLLIGGMIAFTLLVIWFFRKRNYFNDAFSGTSSFKIRLLFTGIILGLSLTFGFFVNNDLAESSPNRYQNELAKAGIYSFFAAFKNNELSYDQFYKLIDNNDAFKLVRNHLSDTSTIFFENDPSIRRMIKGNSDGNRPNVIMITIESFSADFMAHFGNNKHLTPVLDSLADESIFFTDMYATGTRTVRGMEALSLGVPPTPGSSIIRRSGNEGLSTIGNIFLQKGYEAGFFYGGDGYFDNMDKYFGSNGYTVTDRGRNLIVKDHFAAPRNSIPDKFVHFENAWGICDEDLYDAVIRDADAKYSSGKPFYDFVMTTSNHRPYTYPGEAIDIPSGSGRDGAVKYTDYAIGKLMEKIKVKPWFKNTVVIFVADHCASSAGKNEIDIFKYHIPAMIYHLAGKKPMIIDKMSSQIDLYPTLFSLLGWSYTSNFYGKDVLSATYQPRIVLGTYQKLAYMKNDSLVILSPRQSVETFKYRKQSNEQVAMPFDGQLVNEAIAYYQTAYYLFKKGGLTQK